MKKIIALLLISFGLQSQTLLKFKQLERSATDGSLVITTGTAGILTYTSSIDYSKISGVPTLTAYVPYTGATSSVNLGANSFSVGGASTTNTLYVSSTATVNGALLANSTSTLAGNVTQNGIGVGNTVFGTNSQSTSITNGSNTVYGYGASISNSTGIVNTIIGSASASSPSFNATSATFVGYNTGRDNTIGGNNTYVGESAGRGNTSLSDNTGIGKAALLTATSQGNIALGCHAGRYATSKGYELFVGSVNRSSYVNDTTYSILYGVMNSNNNNTNQRLSVNGSLRVYNKALIGNPASDATGFSIFRAGNGTSIFDIGEYSTSNGGTMGLWMNQGAISSTNFVLSRDLTNQTTAFNAPAGCEARISIGAAATLRVFNNRHIFAPGVASSGAIISYEFQNPSNTGQTASTNIPYFKVTGATKTFATGALTTQYFNYLSANTIAFNGASTASDVYGLFVDKTTQGINATITRNWSAGFNGNVQVNGTLNIEGYTVATLPTGVLGDVAYVTDALAPTYLTIIVGGGAITTPVFYNGTNWVAH